MLQTLSRKAAALVLGIFGVLSFAAPVVAAQPLETLKYGVQGERSIYLLPQEVATRKGFFAQQNLKLEVVKFTQFTAPTQLMLNDEALLAALKKNDIQLTVEAVSFLAVEKQKGSDFVAVASVGANPVYTLIGGKDIKTIGDLKGKTIALTEPRDTITLATLKLLALHGLRDGDFKTVHIGGSGARMDCLKSGQCAAASVGPPVAAAAQEAGFNLLGVTNDVVPLLFNVEIAERSWAASHKDQVVRYIRGIASALRFIHDPANRAEVVAIAQQITEQPEAAVRTMLNDYWNPKYRVLTRQGEIDMPGFQAMVDLTADYGFLKKPAPKIDELVDLQYVKAAGVQP